MTFVLVLLLQFVPLPRLPDSTFHLPVGAPAPVEVCTAAGLKLSTKAMTQAETFALARAKFGRSAVVSSSGKTVTIGYTILGWGIEIKPDWKKCPSSNCWKNTNGSWRSAWNSVAIDQCQRRQKK